MTQRQRLGAVGVAALLLLTRSYWLPSRAPTWLRGASPFTWTETRAEKRRCLAFANMIGSTHPQTYYYDEDRKATPVMKIERIMRGGRDSLGIEGTVTRGRYLNYVFYCATANVRGHPGEHRSEIAEPWGKAMDWPSVHAVEERITRSCLDSAVRFYPTSRFGSRTLMLRPAGAGGQLLFTAIDTVYEREPQTVTCWMSVDDKGQPRFVQVRDPNSRF